MKKVHGEGGGGGAGVPKELSMLETRGNMGGGRDRAAMCRGPLSLGQRLHISPQEGG